MENLEVTAPEITENIPEHPGRTVELKELYTALSKFQGEIEEPVNNCYNDHLHYWYPDLGACWKAIRKPLSSNGLLLIQFTIPHPDAYTIRLVTKICHTSGQWESGVLDGRVQDLVLLLENGEIVKGEYNKPVKVAEDSHSNSARAVLVGYLKRLSLCMIAGLSTDGEVPEDSESILAKKAEAKNSQSGGGKKSYTQHSGKKTLSHGNGLARDAQLIGIKKALEIHQLNSESLTKLFNLYGVKNVDELPDQELSSFSKGILSAKKMQDKIKKAEVAG